MSRLGPALAVLAIAVAALMLFPTSAAAPGAPNHAVALPSVPLGTGVRAAGSLAPAAGATTHAQAVLNAIHAAHIPTKDVFLPNFHAKPSVTNGVVSPLYGAAPAPMGLGYFGVRDVAGVDVGTISYTRSVEATVTLNSVDPFYLASSSPDIFTMQLNTVLTHVDVLNDTTGQYWIQNVPIYFANSQTLGIEDNIWNFSSPTAGMQVGTLHSYDGNLVAPTFYYAVGPSWHMPTPFTIRLYNNATIENKRPTVFFNYSITAANGSVISGSFDRVEFNSAVHPTTAAPRPTYQINGQQTNPLGLLNDAEVMIGGPGGGSTTTLLGIDARMALATVANGSTTYKPVPAGSSYGTDTGETSEGIAEWATGGASNPWAVLGPGPSILQPLWGLVGAHWGSMTEKITLNPGNAFAFASLGGMFNADTAAWAPTPASGTLSMQLAPGTYAFKFLLADHNPANVVLSGSSMFTVSLVANGARGVYTPLYAWGNGQLAGISQPGGMGTLAHPYVLLNNGNGVMNPLFGEFNDFTFGVFSGIFLGNTNAYVVIDNAPAFSISYTLAPEAGAVGFFGLPATDNLGMQFYNVSNLALVNTPVITGWFDTNAGTYESNVLFWNSNHNLIAGNTFEVQSVAIILFGGADNWLWGNVFTPATTAAANPNGIWLGTSQVAIEEFNSGDLIYNNAVLTPIPAYTPNYNLYTGAPNTPVDTWNIAPTSSASVQHFLGFSLTGSILGLATVSGNYWGNYGNAQNPYNVLPYSDGGFILSGGDHHPALPYALYAIVFHEKGLPSGSMWGVTINGYTAMSMSGSLTIWEPNGTYAYTVAAMGSTLSPHPGLGAVLVNGGNLSVGIHFK